jgi:hypothetical protein
VVYAGSDKRVISEMVARGEDTLRTASSGLLWSADRAVQLGFFLAITGTSVGFGTYEAIPFAVGMIGWAAWRNRN